MAKRKRTDRQTMVHKTRHRKLKITVGICPTCKDDDVKYQTYLIQLVKL